MINLNPIIRHPITEKDYEGCINVTKSAWNEIPEIEQIPIHIMKAAERSGLFLVAEVDSNIAGYVMCFGYNKDAKLYLHAIGVSEEFKSQNIGYELFRSTLENAKSEGLDEINLTFDPLLGPNANLFIHKMGGQVISPEDYLINPYENTKNETTGGDVPSDRFIAHYDLNSDNIKNIIARKQTTEQFNLDTILNKEVSSFDNSIEDNELYVRIPTDFTNLKSKNKDLAKETILSFRNTLQGYLGKGYKVIDFISTKNNKENFYKLKK
jgi:predicted GNAT superfamily acetyltransferase